MIMKKKGQSTVEYILLVTAVVAVIIVIVNGDKSPFRKKLNTTIDTITNGMEDKAFTLTNMMGNQQ